jgi:hypothetical protein
MTVPSLNAVTECCTGASSNYRNNEQCVLPAHRADPQEAASPVHALLGVSRVVGITPQVVRITAPR